VNAEDVARRHKDRPGCSLISYGEVGLPYYRLTFRAQVLEHKPIGPFAEFALRAVDSGIDEPDGIGRLLGLDDRVLEATVVGLMQSDDLHLTQASGAARTYLALSPKGKRTLENATSVVPEEVEIEVDYDGLTRQPALALDRWLSPLDLKESGGREIPPSRVRPPELSEIDIRGIGAIIRQVGQRRHARRDLLALKAMRRRRIYQPAIALVYRPDDGGEIQIAFAIDGKLSSEHEEAFARSRGRRKIAGGSAEVVDAALMDILSAELVETAHAQQEQAPARSTSRRPTESSGGDEAAVDPLVTPEAPADELPTVRALETFDHPGYLEEALETARDRLLIVSPWVRSAVVNRRFVGRLEARLAGGVEVFIGWGIGPLGQPDQDADPEALRAFKRLADSYRWTFRARRLGATHAKVLICDRRFVIATSFNWLSFRGDPNRTFRDERGFYVSIPEEIDKQFDDWAQRFDPAEPQS
jgi:hypothetical protein